MNKTVEVENYVKRQFFSLMNLVNNGRGVFVIYYAVIKRYFFSD